jgi:Omp85 superfamily domain
MLKLLLMAVAVTQLGMPLLADTGEEALPEFTNVNSRFIVESVNVSGTVKHSLSAALRSDIDQVVGSNLDHSHLDKLADRIKKELHVSDVKIAVTKGTMPDQVTVDFEVSKTKEVEFDLLDVPKFLYSSNQGWSGEGIASARIHGNAFTFGLVSDGDALAERFSGIKARYERKELGTKRLGLSFEFDDFHNQWNQATLSEADPSDIYRTREVFTPEARLVLFQPLELDFGVRFARYRLSTPGAITESSNAVVTTLRYHQRWGSDAKADTDEWRQEADGNYSLESATHVFNSDPTYTRQSIQAHYKVRHGHNRVDLAFLAGRITGLAPLFDRFILGTASTLRGWNKFDLDPVGGSKVVHGSLEYGYHWFEVFYDTGAIWDRPQDREQKQSLGAGVKTKDGFQLAVACPIRSGHATPVFIAGMNF